MTPHRPLACLVLALLPLTTACGSAGTATDDGTGSDAVLIDPGAPDPGPGADVQPPRDLPATDESTDTATPDPGPGDAGAFDDGMMDAGMDPGSDPGAAPDAVAYGRCTGDVQCPEGLVCDLPYADAAYGFCTKQCNIDGECPASTLPIPQGCHKEDGALSGWCTSLCGVNAGGSTTCEDWLQCVASQWCLPPSTTVPTKGPGEACTGGAECLSGDCVEGQSTRAHCALKCTSDDECAGPHGLWKGTCVTAGGLPYNFCIWMCGMMAAGAICPGELACVGMSVCQ